MRVYVYFNLHRKCWSIKAMEGENKGRVIGHAQAVYLMDVEPRVSEAGRQRVIRDGKKNVHAGLIGTLATVDRDSNLWKEFPYYGSTYYTGGDPVQITYNPYKFDAFVDREDTDRKVTEAGLVLLTGDGKVRAWSVETKSRAVEQQMELAV